MVTGKAGEAYPKICGLPALPGQLLFGQKSRNGIVRKISAHKETSITNAWEWFKENKYC